MLIRARLEKFLAPRTVNFWCHVTEGAFASFGEQVVSQAIVFPVLATVLGASPFLLGALSSMPKLSFIAPVVAVGVAEATRRKKKLVLLLGLGQRLPLLLIGFCLLALAGSSGYLCLILISLLMLLRSISVSLLAPPWIDLLSETIPRRSVGRLFGSGTASLRR